MEVKTGIVKDWRYVEHNMGDYHPESPRRIQAIYEMLEEEKIFSSLSIIEPRPAKHEEIALIHAQEYVEQIKKTAGRERVCLDPDTSTSPRSCEVALLAAGGLLEAADRIMEGRVQNGFALVRPPGHHAEASQARGFCIFNNIAIAAQYLIEKWRLRRVLIVDWDIHHGNGTQNSFYSRNDVLYFSTHQFPHYPGTGHWSEVGKGKGEGFTVNVPLTPGKADDDFLFIYRELLRPIAGAFKPEFILVSAGFDVFAGDPLGGMEVSVGGFGALTAELMGLAHQTAQDRILFTLEGGYNLSGLRDGVKSVLLALNGRGQKSAAKLSPSSALEGELAPVFKVTKVFWPVGA
ncbi:MAG TPA: histone deacetylase [Candidatus Desulfaltia sp.]|nr:histone deacetylase [Candidatus Desulfaltia sp.]